MRKTAILGAVIASILAISIVVSLEVSGEQKYNFPNWIKEKAKKWSQGKLADADFYKALQTFVDKNILSKSTQSKVSQKDYDKVIKYSTELQKQNKKLESEIDNLRDSVELWKNKYYEEANQADGDSCEPLTTIQEQIIKWKFCDSKGNLYSWQMPVEGYEEYVLANPDINLLYLELPDGSTVEMFDFRDFVTKGFVDVIDDIYKNAESDEDFVYEVWYITSQLTIYSYDIGEYPRYALETLSRGGGDCEDTSILIADMIRSSSHTRNWEIQFVYFDADNPDNPKDVNHVAVVIDTGKSYYVIESTAKDEDSMNQWAEKEIFGWRYDV